MEMVSVCLCVCVFEVAVAGNFGEGRNEGGA